MIHFGLNIISKLYKKKQWKSKKHCPKTLESKSSIVYLFAPSKVVKKNYSFFGNSSSGQVRVQIHDYDIFWSQYNLQVKFYQNIKKKKKIHVLIIKPTGISLIYTHSARQIWFLLLSIILFLSQKHTHTRSFVYYYVVEISLVHSGPSTPRGPTKRHRFILQRTRYSIKTFPSPNPLLLHGRRRSLQPYT